VAMILFATFTSRQTATRLRGIFIMTLAVVVTIIPWSIRNYVREAMVVPVASMAGTVLGLGNNECLAREPLLSAYWADGECIPLDIQRASMLGQLPLSERESMIVQDRIYATLGLRFIAQNPVEYLRLCLRRAWTGLLPFHPKQGLGKLQRIGLSLYWVAIIPAGLIGLLYSPRRPSTCRTLLALLIGTTFLPLILVYFSPDMRYRVGADLLLACFAGWAYTGFRTKPYFVAAP